MSYLLGNKVCMNSLAADVRGLQQVIVDVVSRVGPLQAKSWKFPDKKAGDPDIDDLLDLYNRDDDDDFDDPEIKQVGHIALYELVIDRLIFMVQAMPSFCRVQLTTGQQMTTQTADVETNIGGSVGLIVRNYWAQVSKLQTMYQQILLESKSKQMRMNGVEKKNNESFAEDTKESHLAISDYKSSPSFTITEMPGTRGEVPPNNADLALAGKAACVGQNSLSSISRDTNNKSCQTFETAFVPCDLCDVIQRRLRDAGEVIIKVCTDQGLPCTLRKFRNEVNHVDMLYFNDICRWMVEQNKDIVRIAKQNEILQASIDPLRADVKVFEKKTKAAEEKAQTFEKNMKEEVDTRVHLRKQFELNISQPNMAATIPEESKTPYVFLGRSGLKVSNISLGTLTFGENQMGRPGQSDEDVSHQIINRYVEWGGNFLDTADVYGLGNSETIIGKWLETQPRDKYVIATKCRVGFNLQNNINNVGLSRRHITASIDKSLQRLHTDFVDIYQTHVFDDGTPIEETLRTLDDLVRIGKIRYIGVSNVTGWQLSKLVETTKHLGLNSVIYRGFLTGKVKRGERPSEGRIGWVAENESKAMQSAPSWKSFDEKSFDVLEAVEALAKKHSRSIPQVAIRWLLQRDVVSSVIIGARTLAQLDDNMGVNGWSLTQEEAWTQQSSQRLFSLYDFYKSWNPA